MADGTIFRPEAWAKTPRSRSQYGSVRAGMSGSTVLAKLEYYPYGEVYSMSGGGSVYTFLGKEDPGVGMLDFGPRYYNAMLGRFLSPDPILAGASAPDIPVA